MLREKLKQFLYGVDTNATSRALMFEMLPEIVETEYDKFVSPHILKGS